MHFLRSWLAIGTLRDTQAPGLLRERKIGAMLQLAESVPQSGIDSLYLAVDDGVPVRAASLDRGVAFVLEQRALGRNVLVASGLGISRSVTFALAALKEAENLSLAEAMREVRRAHPEARPHPALWRSLCQRYGEEVPYRVVLTTLREE